MKADLGRAAPASVFGSSRRVSVCPRANVLARAERRLASRAAWPSCREQRHDRFGQRPELRPRHLTTEPGWPFQVRLNVMSQNQIQPLRLVIAQRELPDLKLDLWGQ